MGKRGPKLSKSLSNKIFKLEDYCVNKSIYVKRSKSDRDSVVKVEVAGLAMVVVILVERVEL